MLFSYRGDAMRRDDGVIDDAQKKPRSAGLMTVYFSRIA